MTGRDVAADAATGRTAGSGGGRTLSRRRLLRDGLGVLAGLAGAAFLGGTTAGSGPAEAGARLPAAGTAAGGSAATETAALIADIEERTFRYFWQTTNPANGLARDRVPSPSAASIAATGFALAACPIGAERGFISRKAARERVLQTLRFLHDAPQGPQSRGVAGYKGFFYHYLDMITGMRDGASELSTVDTAFLLAGVLFCRAYFDRAHGAEAAIRSLADAIYSRVDWRWAQPAPPAISHGWSPECGFIPYDWRGYNEALIVYLLALGSPSFPVDRAAFDEWTSGYSAQLGAYGGRPHIAFAALSGHLFNHAFVDFRGLAEPAMAGVGLDMIENTRRAIEAQRAYTAANPMGWKGYDADGWGLGACDGPGEATVPHDGALRSFRAYAARGAAGPEPFDDGTLSPAAVIGALPLDPEAAIPAIAALDRRYGDAIFRRYGYVDAYNPSFDCRVPPAQGTCLPGIGWVGPDHIGIDQGLILAMVENYRSGLVWRVMRRSAPLRRGLVRAGFTGGWLGTAG